LHAALIAAQRTGNGAQAGANLTPLFGVALMFACRELMLLALDQELTNANHKS
jgi:hypothetical protein